MKLHLCLFLMNPKYYQNETWSNTSVLHNKHFYQVIWLNVGDWKLVPGPLYLIEMTL